MRTLLGIFWRLLVCIAMYLAACALLGFTLGVIAGTTYNVFKGFIS